WSSYPSVAATPPLVVATTGNPAATTALAVATSQAFGSRRGSPVRCSDRSRSQRRASSVVCESVMFRNLRRRMPAGGPSEALGRDTLPVTADVVDATGQRERREKRSSGIADVQRG